MTNTIIDSNRSDKPVWYFILCWTAFNLLQAGTIELHPDEAYYWLYAQKLDWGYFYHPPMMALFIKIGDTFFHNEFGTRLIAVLTNGLAIYLLWLIVKKYSVSAKWFMLLVSGILVIHVYAFTTTPDNPLFFFAVLFYYAYQKYLEKDSWLTALIIGVIAACLLYSKYHGVLLLGFTVISNPRLFTRRTFYLAIAVGLLCFTPHILWQAHRDFPAVNYQLFERATEKPYKLEVSLVFIAGQLLLGGIISSWYLFYKSAFARITDQFTRTLKFNLIGVFGFFLLNTFYANVQPHYTLIGFIPLLVLALIHLQSTNGFPRWFVVLSIINIILIIILRVSLMLGLPYLKQIQVLQTYYGFKDWAKAVHNKAGNAYMIMDDGFQNPSKYDFYNRTFKGFAYDSRYYGRTMFDIWPMEDSLQHQRAYLLLSDPLPGVSTDTIRSEGDDWYGGWVNDVRTYQKIAIDPHRKMITAHPGQYLQFDLTLTNPYPFDVSFADSGYTHPAFLEACFFKGRMDIIDVQQAPLSFKSIIIKKGASVNYLMTVKAPKQKGKYALFFSIRTEPFRGAKNSPLLTFIVE